MSIKKEFNIPAGLNEDTIVRTKKGKEFTIGEIQNSNRIQKSAKPKPKAASKANAKAKGEEERDEVSRHFKVDI